MYETREHIQLWCLRKKPKIYEIKKFI
jgi:hypothetical protein